MSMYMPIFVKKLRRRPRWVSGVGIALLTGSTIGPLPAVAQTPVEPEGASLVQDPEPEAHALLDALDLRELGRSRDSGPGTHPGTGARSSEIPAEPPAVPILRIAPADYGDGISSMAGSGRPGPREISNSVLSQSESIPSERRASDMVWQWGQFIDHDIDLTDVGVTEDQSIEVPLGDPFFDPLGEGGKTIPFSRSIFDPASGSDASNPREQVNVITGLIDASNVYGSDLARANALRTLDGSGRLEVSSGDLLPFNTSGFPNAGGAERSDLFLAGDVRANEQVLLTCMHTLWVREHNFWAGEIRRAAPQLSDDEIYRGARSIVRAEIQSITFREFLPLLLGRPVMGRYHGWRPSVDPGIATEFSTAAYRLGHTMLSGSVLRLDRRGKPIPEGPLALRDAFFAPQQLISVGLEPYMKGLASQVMQRVDTRIVDDVRNFLFGPPGAGGLDLAALNIQRGRDHGLPDYNGVRIAYGLAPVASFADITGDPTVRSQLEAAYGNVNDIDAWVGALAEDHLPGALVGKLLHVALTEQFERLRDGDPDWYENRFHPLAVALIQTQTLAKVIARNTQLRRSDLQPNVFMVPQPLIMRRR